MGSHRRTRVSVLSKLDDIFPLCWKANESSLKKKFESPNTVNDSSQSYQQYIYSQDVLELIIRREIVPQTRSNNLIFLCSCRKDVLRTIDAELKNKIISKDNINILKWTNGEGENKLHQRIKISSEDDKKERNCPSVLSTGPLPPYHIFTIVRLIQK